VQMLRPNMNGKPRPQEIDRGMARRYVVVIERRQNLFQHFTGGVVIVRQSLVC